MEQFANRARTTFAAPVAAVAAGTSEVITVTSVESLPSGPAYRLVAKGELMLVTAVDGMNLTVIRGVEGTAPVAHKAGDTLTHVLTLGALQAYVGTAAAGEQQRAENVESALSGSITSAIATAEAASDAAGTAAADVAAERDEREGADALLVPLSQKGAHNGVASLDGSGLLPISELPAPNAGGHYEQNFGDSTHSSFTITHNLKTLTPDITVVNQSTGLEEGCRKKVVDENTVELAATAWEATPPSVAAYRVSIDASSGLVSTNGTVLTSYAQKSEVGANSGIAPLDSGGLLPTARLPGSAVSSAIEAVQRLIGPLSSLYFAQGDDESILVNTSTLAPAANWTKGGLVGDSGPALQAAFVAAREARVLDPTGATSLRRGRRAIPFPAGAFYTAMPLAMMTAGGNRTIGLRYVGKGKGLTQIVFQPPVGEPRHVSDAHIKARTLESASAKFTKEDIGHRVLVFQAGGGGGVLDTVITNFVNATTVEVGIEATAEVSNATCQILADAPLFFNADRWADVQLEGLEFIALQPTGEVPPTKVSDGTLGVTVADGAMAVGSSTLTSVSAPFTPDMVGLTVTVAGGAAGKGILTTVITTFNSPTSVTLEAANGSGESIAARSVSVFSNILQLGRVVSDAAIAEKAKKLTSKTANFTEADLGTFVGIAGAGTAGGLLLTTIQKIVSTEEVLTAQEALTTVAGAQLTMGGRTITGKHIGNTAEVEGAGVAGAKLTATVLSIRLRDINGVPSTEMQLSSACSTVVSGAATTLNCAVNAIFWRSTSLGGVEGPVARDCIWRGAWAEGYCLDGTNQNADVYWDYCKVFDRPGTFLHQLPDPALNLADDQMLDFSFNRGVLALTYGDTVFFDGRGGYLKMDGGAHTIGGVFTIAEDAGGKLPVEVKGNLEDPGGTRFKARDYGTIALNRRHLKITDVNFEERNNASLIYDIAWANGQVEVANCSDASSQGTSPNTFFARMAFLSVSGPSVTHTNCTWKGRHLFRYKNAAWRYAHSVYYRTCDITQQEAAKLFAICGTTDGGTSITASQPIIHFVDGCKGKLSVENSGYEDNFDSDVNWLVGVGAPVSRLRKWLPGGNQIGLPKTGETSTMLVPYGCQVIRLQLWVPPGTSGASENEDWTVTVTDNAANTLHTFKAGEDGIAAKLKWKEGPNAFVNLALPFFCTSNANRTLLAKVGGTGTTAQHEAFLLAETIG